MLKFASQVVIVVKNSPANAGDIRDSGSILGPGRSSIGGHGKLLPGESHGQRSLEDYSPWGRTESDTTEETWHACHLEILMS